MAAGYLDMALRNQRVVVDSVVDAIKRIEASGTKIDAIAWRGTSGAVVAPVVTYLLGKPMMVVRKDTKDCHSVLWVEDALPEAPKTYVIIDDLVCSGKTIRAIDERVHQLYPASRLLAVICYDSDLTDTRMDVDAWSIPVLGSRIIQLSSLPQLGKMLLPELCYSERNKAKTLTPEEVEYKKWAEQNAALTAELPPELPGGRVESVEVRSLSSVKAGEPVYWSASGKLPATFSETVANVQPLPDSVIPWWKGMTGYDVLKAIVPIRTPWTSDDIPF